MPIMATGTASVGNLLNSITYYLVHTLLVDLVHWVLGHQTGEVCLQPL